MTREWGNVFLHERAVFQRRVLLGVGVLAFYGCLSLVFVLFMIFVLEGVFVPFDVYPTESRSALNTCALQLNDFFEIGRGASLLEYLVLFTPCVLLAGRIPLLVQGKMTTWVATKYFMVIGTGMLIASHGLAKILYVLC